MWLYLDLLTRGNGVPVEPFGAREELSPALAFGKRRLVSFAVDGCGFVVDGGAGRIGGCCAPLATEVRQRSSAARKKLAIRMNGPRLDPVSGAGATVGLIIGWGEWGWSLVATR